MKLLIDNYEIADAGNRAGDIYVTHCGAVDLITVKGRNEDFTILYHQTPVKDLSMEETKRIHEWSGMDADMEISELEVWWKSGEQHGCIMVHHSNPELCPDHLKAENSYFSKEETVTEPVEVKPTRDQIFAQVVKEFAKDIAVGDLTAIDELLTGLPDEVLHAYLSDNAQAELADKVGKPATKLRCYEVNMGRTGYGSAIFHVEAYNEDEARAKAGELALNHEYSEHSSSYGIIDIEEI